MTRTVLIGLHVDCIIICGRHCCMYTVCSAFFNIVTGRYLCCPVKKIGRKDILNHWATRLCQPFYMVGRTGFLRAWLGTTFPRQY